jgi:type III secretion protein J
MLAAFLPLAGCLQQEISTGMTEKDAQEMIVLLKENGLDATRKLVAKEREAPSWAVYVKGGDQNMVLAWRILQENGLPRDKVKGLEEVYADKGMIPTSGEERAKYLVGISGELSRTLRSISGVADARVHVVLPENSPLVDRDKWLPPSASVLMKYRTSGPPLAEASIKALIAKAVEGLKPDDITVVMQKVTPASYPPRNIGWYAGNQEFTLIALALLVAVSLMSIALMARMKSLQWQVRKLREAAAAQEK